MPRRRLLRKNHGGSKFPIIQSQVALGMLLWIISLLDLPPGPVPGALFLSCSMLMVWAPCVGRRRGVSLVNRRPFDLVKAACFGVRH